MREEIKAELRKLGVRPDKDLGQSFLIDSGALSEIVDFGSPQKGEPIIEIGPGLGALTGALRYFGNLSVIEIEPNFCAYIANKFPDVKVIQGDIREQDLSEFGRDLIIFGNLPYSFSTEITILMIQYAEYIKRATFLLQKEFAQRLAASPGSKKYGTLSVALQIYAKTRLGPIIGGDCFYPPVAVESQVIKLEFREEPLAAPELSYWVQLVTKAAFYRRRKKVGNSMRASKSIPAEIVEQALKDAEISPDERAENVSVQEYIKLASSVSKLSSS